MEASSSQPEKCLGPTAFIDSASPEVRAYVEGKISGLTNPAEKAKALFHGVRDDIHYDPYCFDGTLNSFIASKVIGRGRGFCVPKAVVLAATLRAAGIPARLGFADVRNHLTTDKLRSRMGGIDIFVFHGYTEAWLDGRWIKITPTFNLSLCEKFGVKPLDWDGRTDAIFHPFDSTGRKHMEYVRDRGQFDDLPLADILTAWKEVYGNSLVENGLPGGDFAAEARPISG